MHLPPLAFIHLLPPSSISTSLHLPYFTYIYLQYMSNSLHSPSLTFIFSISLHLPAFASYCIYPHLPSFTFIHRQLPPIAFIHRHSPSSTSNSLHSPSYNLYLPSIAFKAPPVINPLPFGRGRNIRALK